jgi:hypothetical protein
MLSKTVVLFLALGLSSSAVQAIPSRNRHRPRQDPPSSLVVPTATGIVTAANGVPTPGHLPFTPEVNGSPNAWPLLISRANKPGKQNNSNGGKGNGNPNPGNGNPNPGTGNNNGGDPQTSLTLDPRVIADGFKNDGQGEPTPGQVASLTSSNNFINFCITTNKPITNGQQIKDGSCNPAPMGVIASATRMPSSKFEFPPNLATLKANTGFTIKMAINNLDAGHFVNAQQNYYSAPQQVNNQGVIIGHTHFVIQAMDSLTSTKPLDPSVFAFFKGVNTAAGGDGTVSVPVDTGLPAGTYRLACINTAANHQPVLVAIAQHGHFDDMVYFTVNDNGQPVPPPNSPNNVPGGAAPPPPPPPGSPTNPPAKGKGRKGGKKSGKGSGAP